MSVKFKTLIEQIKNGKLPQLSSTKKNCNEVTGIQNMESTKKDVEHKKLSDIYEKQR